MSQYDFGTINASTKSGTALASDLNSWRSALHSLHSGSSRPSYAVSGMMWIDTTSTPWVLKLYDGSGDITLGTVNASTNVVEWVINNSFITTARINDLAVTAAKVANATLTVAKFANNTDGALLSWDASGVATVIPPGTADYVLKSNGAGALPSWQVEDGGTMKLLSTTDVAGSPATIDITGFDSGAYDIYSIRFGNIRSANNADFRMRTSADGGSTFDSGSSDYLWGGTSTTSSYLAISGNQDVGNGSDKGISGTITLYYPHLALRPYATWEVVGRTSSGAIFSSQLGGCRNASAAVNAVRLYFDVGTFGNQGTISLYAIKNS